MADGSPKEHQEGGVIRRLLKNGHLVVASVDDMDAYARDEIPKNAHAFGHSNNRSPGGRLET